VQFGIGSTGQEDFFFCLCPKNKALHWAVSKWFSEFAWAKQWEYCYVSMNHFETATATEQQKGIAQKRNPLAHPKGGRDTPHPSGWGAAEQS
jgi:hypothetical protein